MKIVLWMIVIVAIIEQNSYFGWNALPQSDMELVTDLIISMMVMLAILKG